MGDAEIERVRCAVGRERREEAETGEEERFEVGDSFVTDMRHRVAPRDAGLPDAFWRIVAYEGRIVEAATAWGRPGPLDTAIRCRRRPRRRPCPGHLRVRVDDGDILWACTRCRDNGRIYCWQGLEWDFSGDQLDDGALRVRVSWADFGALQTMDTRAMRVLRARAIYGVQGPTLVGSAADLRRAAMACADTGAEDVAGVLFARIAAAGGSVEA
jgi:hypothetical protein